MLAYISLGIGVSNILAAVIFLLIWVELHVQIKNNPILRQDFRATARRLMISVGFFGFPILEYLFAGSKQSAKIIQPFALVWGAGSTAPPNADDPPPIAQFASNGNLKLQESGAWLTFSCEIDYSTRRVSPAASTITRFFTDDDFATAKL